MKNNQTISPINLSDLATKINQAHDAAETSARTAIEHALDAGRLLCQAKALCPHGQWGKWLADNFKGSDRTARDWMRLSENQSILESENGGAAVLSIRSAIEILNQDEQSREETFDLYDAVEHPTYTPDQWRAVFANLRECEPGPDPLRKFEREAIEQSWDELTIGRAYALMRDSKYADDPAGFDDALREACERIAIGFHRLHSHIIAWDRYAAGESDPNEPDFEARMRAWMGEVAL